MIVLEPRETFDVALVGVMWDDGREVAVYDEDQIIQQLMLVDGMDEDVAIEHFEYNIQGSIFEGCPRYIKTDLSEVL